jgi:eukaryotic-like serine/threonine-protein kinase
MPSTGIRRLSGKSPANIQKTNALPVTAPEVTSHFLKLLADSRLLSAARIRRAITDFQLADCTAVAETASAFVGAGLLTTYQAQRLLAGRARGFFYGPYLVLDALGAGGMGHVFLARHVKTGQRVALKVLSDKVEHDAGFLTRLKLEARVGQIIRHPRIVATGQLGETAGGYYLPMQYVPGIELQELIEYCHKVHVNYDADAGQICDFIRQAAEGLHAAHEAGIIHRDVKPQNLLIDQTGGVKLLDFGLSHTGPESAEDEFSLAMIFGHDRVGTPQYMSPEQALDCSHVDRRTDLYSLGCTLYHALTGEFPFPASGQSNREVLSRILEAHRTAQPPPLLADGRSAPAGLAAVVTRMMAKRPEDRYHSAMEVAVALSPFARRQPLSVDVDDLIARRVARIRPLLASSGTGSRVGD